MDIILYKLDKIIKELEKIRIILDVNKIVLSTITPECNCKDYKHGELTSGWYCPVHGQCY